ncbi:MAG: T9SS type A sorting domain-containing protein [Bacteroidia bacterium]|nr:T9SS type A sorting domain-containing protein [Bacteroidia bacterium]
MKTQTIIIGLMVSAVLSQAQVIQDTVSIGAGYANEKWYSLQNDEQGSAPKNNWDIAFETSGMGAAIHINSVIGTKLWCYPHGDTSAWNSIDTTGISTWKARYNSDTSWSVGAFNVPVSSNPYDLGWGIYNNITHEVTGDSIYIIKLSNNTYKKMWIKKLSGGTYYFQYADLNGSNLVNTSVAKSSYNTKTLVYYSIQNNITLDREPLSANWDIVFKQYTAFIPTPYTVTGVLGNKGVSVAKVHPVNTSTYNQWYNHIFQTAINTIGYDWKNYTGTWVIEDSLVYFVKSKQGDIWKVVFAGFGGSANGNYIFTKEKISTASVQQFFNTASFVIYPNPTTDLLHLIIDDNSQDYATIQVIDALGKIILKKNIILENKFTDYIFDVTDWKTGIYFISIQTQQQFHTQKFIKN